MYTCSMKKTWATVTSDFVINSFKFYGISSSTDDSKTGQNSPSGIRCVLDLSEPLNTPRSTSELEINSLHVVYVGNMVFQVFT